MLGVATALWCWRQSKSDLLGTRTWGSRVSMGLDFDQLDPRTGQLRSADVAWWSRRILRIGAAFGVLVAVLGIVSLAVALSG